MTKTTFVRQRVSDITPTDVALCLEKYRSLPAMTLRADRGVVAAWTWQAWLPPGATPPRWPAWSAALAAPR